MFARFRPPLIAGLAIASCAAFQAHAVDAVAVDAVEADGYARITLEWPEAAGDAPISARAEIDHGVVVVRLSQPIDADVSALPQMLTRRVALARLDPGGAILRIALRDDARTHVSVSYNVLAIDLIDPSRSEDPPDVVSDRERAEIAAAEEARRRAEAAAAIEPVVLPLNVRAAESADYARIIFDWTSAVDHVLEQVQGVAEVRFSEDALPNLTRLRTDPPRGLLGVEEEHEDGALVVRLIVDEGFVARSWNDGPKVIVDLAPAGRADTALAALEELERALIAAEHESDDASVEEPEVADHAEVEPSLAGENEHHAEAADHGAAEDTAPHDAPEDHAAIVSDPVDTEVLVAETRVDPVPASGVVRAQVTPVGGDLHVAFSWAAPAGAAAFRRGDALWIVFNAEADIDIGELVRGAGRHVSQVQVVRGEGYSALRARIADATQVAVQQDGPMWNFILSEAVEALPLPVAIAGDADGSQPGRLVVEVENATEALRVSDPAVGDTLFVVTALGPIQGVPARRAFLEVAALASAHGVAFEAGADDVTAQVVPDGVIVGRPDGLALSPRRLASVSGRERVNAAVMPGFIDFDNWSVEPARFATRHDQLARRAAVAADRSAARIELARFLVAHELAGEAVGLLNLVFEDDPAMLNDAGARALRGAANAMLGRTEAARADFASPQLARDSAAALWRGLLAARDEDWREARRQFEMGRDALFLFRSDWRGHFRTAYAEAVLELNDLGAARQAIDEVLSEETPDAVHLRAGFVEALYFEAVGETDRALMRMNEVAAGGYEPVETPALREAIRMEQNMGLISTADAIDRLEILRLRWRGDAVELDIARALGRLYVQAGDIRLGLNIMRAASVRFPDNPVARDLFTEMSDIFERLYLEGEASQLGPVQALALWYEFNDLTPVGAEGDRMIRRLTDRLIEFDLLGQAADLLQHQVDNRLRGAARAQVAVDLATVYLMDRRAEAALNAIRETRIAQLPSELNAERRLIEARALSALGQRDHAIELLASDRSPAAARLRADIAWDLQDWARAGRLIETGLEEAWLAPGVLPADVQRNVLRAAIAMNLGEDEQGLTRVVQRYDARMRQGEEASSWRVVTSETDTTGVRLVDLARHVAEIDTLDAFLDEFRARRATGAAATDGAP